MILKLYKVDSTSEITFHRLKDDVLDNGYFPIDNPNMHFSFITFDAVETVLKISFSLQNKRSRFVSWPFIMFIFKLA